MKLITINTHSLIEKDYELKCRLFTEKILNERPEIIAMQEANQTFSKSITGKSFAVGNIPIKEDNHALKIKKMLEENGAPYHMVWLGIKKSYDYFEEGLAFLTVKPITNQSAFLISKKDDYNNWKTRKALLIECDNSYFCNVHMGWWNDAEEPFHSQWKRLNQTLQNIDNVYLMGDFNSPAENRGEGYDKVCESGWFDTFKLAKKKDDGYTVCKNIDGWENMTEKQMRIDYIFSKKLVNVNSSFCIFDGKNGEIVSDHSGVMVEIDNKEKL